MINNVAITYAFLYKKMYINTNNRIIYTVILFRKLIVNMGKLNIHCACFMFIPDNIFIKTPLFSSSAMLDSSDVIVTIASFNT